MSIRTNEIAVACPRCHLFFDAAEAALVQCVCGFSFVAVRCEALTQRPAEHHSCLPYTGRRLATNDGVTLYALSAAIHHGDGSCGMSNCKWGAPFLLANDAEESDIFSAKQSRTNIYPVSAPPKVMLHATTWNSLIGILRHGLLPKNDPRMDKHRYAAHGNQRTEGWLRFTGQRKAATAHLVSGADGLIVPIAYDGLVLQSCMGLFPENLMRLFAVIPSCIGSIRMDEDGESYVFRKNVPLMLSFKHLPVFLWAGVTRTLRVLFAMKGRLK